MFKYFIICASFLLVSCASKKNLMYVENTLKEKEYQNTQNEKLKLENKLKKTEEQIKELNFIKQKLFDKNEELENKETELNILHKKITDNEKEIKKVTNKKIELEQKLQELEENIKQAKKDKEKDVLKIKNLEKIKENLESAKEKLEKEQQILEAERNDLKVQKEILEQQKKDLIIEKDELINGNKELKKEKQDLENQKLELERQLQKLKEELEAENKKLMNKIKNLESSYISTVTKNEINSSLKMLINKTKADQKIADTITNNNTDLNSKELEKAKNLLYGFYYLKQLNEIAKSNDFNSENVKRKLSYILKEKLKFNNIVISGNFSKILKSFNTEYDFNDSVIKIEKFLTAYKNKDTTNLVYLYKDTDPSFTGETLPENIEKIIADYKEKLKIMKFLKDTNLYDKLKTDIETSEKEFNEIVTKSLDNKVLKLDYDTANNDFKFIFNETEDDKISFEKLAVNKKDFKNDTDNFKIAKIKRNLIISDEYYHGFVKLNNYITKNGFADENERNFRKNEIKNIIDELLNIVNTGTDLDDAMEDDETLKQKYEKLKKLQDNELLDLTAYEDIKKIKLLQTILSKDVKPLFIYKEKEITDTIKLGGEGIGLKYSNFGLWKVEGKDKLSGLQELKKHFNVGDVLPNEATNYYAFTYAVDEYEQRFMKNLNASDDDKMIFTGKNIAGVSNKNNNYKEFTGDAKLTVSNKTATADLILNFKNWYEIEYKNLNVGIKNGLTTNLKPELRETINIDNNFKFQNKDNIESKLQLNSYGYYKPEEVIGTFHINDNNLSSDGAFGVISKK